MGWTVQNTFDAIKIALAVVAGIGGVVALTVAYRSRNTVRRPRSGRTPSC
jgi:hypothetical protein